MPMDRSKYPPDWPEISRRVRAAADDRCQCAGECDLTHPGGRCDRVNGAPLTYNGHGKIVLTVAHLCRDASCGDESHLRAMCQRCHLRYDRFSHAQHARETRRRKRDQESGQLSLEVKDV